MTTRAASASPETRRAAPLHVLATINGPGEVAAWLFPFVHALHERAPDTVVTVALLPCVFASGREADVLGEMRGIDRVLTPQESLQWIMRGRDPAGLTTPDVVMHLGGEVLLSVRLARRLGAPLLVYDEGRPRWPTLATRVCVRDPCPGHDASGSPIRVIGNLMVDAARLRVPNRVPSARSAPTIALFPGSRPYFVKHLVPTLLRVARLVERERADARFVLAKSDFVTVDSLRASLAPGSDRLVPGDDGVLRSDGRRALIESATGTRIEILSPAEAMRRAGAAVTIPGTNTAELGALGIPMLLILPAYRLHALPLPGLAGHLGALPVLGPLIKEAVARTYLRTRRYWAHPNRLARRMIVPELIGRITPEQIAERLLQLLASPLSDTSAVLRQVMGAPGASYRLVDEVFELARRGRSP